MSSSPPRRPLGLFRGFLLVAGQHVSKAARNTAGGELFVGVAESDVASGRQRSWATLVGSPRGRPPIPLRDVLVAKTRQIIHATNGTPYIRKGAQNLPVDTEGGLDVGACNHRGSCSQTERIPARIS
jgi:hypothetical protein